jgi:tetratricopeptide (TPR) repeat protein
MEVSMLTDRYGLALSTDSSTVRDAYVRAVDCLLAAGVSTVEKFESVIALEPACALAHAGHARSLAMYGRGAEARAAAARGVELAQSATQREQQHVATIALAIEGKAQAATSAMLLHLDDFPRDAVVLSLTTGVFGLYGMSGRLDREQLLLDLLDRVAPAYGEDAWFLSQHAFAECECGRFEAAESHAERALELDAMNAWGAHARAHVYYELGQDEAADGFLTGWLPTYARGSLLHSHLSWHTALGALMRGDPDRARSTFDPHMDPHRSGQPPLIAFTDAVSLLWRMELAGCAREAAAWPALRSYALEKFPKAGMTYADVHSAIAFAVTADLESWERLAAQVREGAGRQWGAEIAYPVIRGFEAFSRANWSSAIEALAPAIDSLVRISGSRAQRDLVVNTLFAAYVRAGRSEEAQAFLGGRGKRIPLSPGIGTH